MLSCTDESPGQTVSREILFKAHFEFLVSPMSCLLTRTGAGFMTCEAFWERSCCLSLFSHQYMNRRHVYDTLQCARHSAGGNTKMRNVDEPTAEVDPRNHRFRVIG